MTYQTKQKDELLEIIKKLKREFLIKDLYNELKGKIGLTTIYRLIDKLVDEGVVLKTIGKDNVACYQYLGVCEEENHFYLKCLECGKLEHIDCECIGKLTNHILQNHHFVTSKVNIVLSGWCCNCKERVL